MCTPTPPQQTRFTDPTLGEPRMLYVVMRAEAPGGPWSPALSIDPTDSLTYARGWVAVARSEHDRLVADLERRRAAATHPALRAYLATQADAARRVVFQVFECAISGYHAVTAP